VKCRPANPAKQFLIGMLAGKDWGHETGQNIASFQKPETEYCDSDATHRRYLQPPVPRKDHLSLYKSREVAAKQSKQRNKLNSSNDSVRLLRVLYNKMPSRRGLSWPSLSLRLRQRLGDLTPVLYNSMKPKKNKLFTEPVPKILNCKVEPRHI
jgi:hypothetical protein